MSYIGNNLQVAYPSYTNIDDISGSFNGVTTSFALTVGGVAPVPAPLSSNQCMISVGGVIQRPDDTGTEGFRLSGGNIVFSSAPNTGEDFFGVILAGADYVNVGVNYPSGTAAAPSITFDTDLDTGLFNPGANQLGITTAGTSRLVVDSSGNVAVDTNTLYVDATNNRVGVGTTSPTQALHVVSATTNNILIETTSNSTRALFSATGKDSGGNNVTALFGPYGDGPLVAVGSTTNHDFRFITNNTERARIDSSGRLLVGTSTNLRGSKLQVLSTGNDHQSLIGGNQIAQLELCRSSNSAGGAGVVASGDIIARIDCLGNDGSAYRSAGRIEVAVDGTPGANDMPGRLVFSTTADGASSSTERMRITSGGETLVGNTTVFSASSSTATGNLLHPDGYAIHFASGQQCLYLGRQTSDGSIVSIRQAGTEEGSISVSGTTVSYNGAHLSRWSQLPFGQDREQILRGTVLSNIDEMCEWGDEENEQLNRMKVSDVEGDKNVSGVFQAWDDDDDTYTNDFYCAMTGDFIIRIAAGVTVERGDLLMSAGDGTAKPQGDGFVQDKTVAKVTSTNVSCTYDDGSYCVPCVLMAC